MRRDEEKLQILESFLRKHNLSLGNRSVDVFFNERRKTLAEVRRDNLNLKLDYGPIEPTIVRTTPLDFENNGYESTIGDATKSVKEWFLYANMEDNPLVFNNLGTDQSWILDSFQNTRRKVDPAFMSADGRLFNGGDGNHRLLALMMNQFVERMNARTDEERKMVDDKYMIEVPVSYPHDKELCQLLEKEKIKVSPDFSDASQEGLPFMVREYRAHHQGSNNLYVAKFNRKNGIYTYDFNGTRFSGTGEELKLFLKNKKQSKNSSMIWNDGQTYYVSSNNYVIKSKNNIFIQNIFNELEMNVKNKAENSPYLVVFDADKNKYEIQTNALKIEESESIARKKIIDFGYKFLEDSSNNYFFDVFGIDKNEIRTTLDQGEIGIFMAFDQLKAENLNKEELIYVERRLDLINKELSNAIEITNNSDKLQNFSQEFVSTLKSINETNESLLGVSMGLMKNEYLADKEKAVKAKRTFENGRVIAQWGYGRLLNKYEELNNENCDVLEIPKFNKDEELREKRIRLEEYFKNPTNAFSDQGYRYVANQFRSTELQISQLEYLRNTVYDEKMKKCLNELIEAMNVNFDACSDLLKVVESAKGPDFFEGYQR